MTVPALRYSRWMMALHWSTAVVVLAAYFLSEGGPNLRLDPPRWHFITGMAVLLLVIPRLLTRAMGGAPPLLDSGSQWLNVTVKLGHATLYALLIAVPLTGWYAMSRLGVSFSILGYSLPMLTAPVQGYPGLVGDVHQWGGNAILILAGGHAALALWHHFFRHDDTLRRMSPL